jgi:hypothetical protein
MITATWISAIATVVLAAGAGFTVFYARQAFRAQSAQLRLLQADTDRQARQLERQQAGAVDLTWWVTEKVTVVMGGNLRYNGRSVVVIANRSPRPIRDVTCRVYRGDGTTLKPERAGPFWSDGKDALKGPVFQPHAAASAPVIRANNEGGFLIELPLRTDTRMSARFTDDAGLHWQVDQELHLEKLDERDW